MIFAISQFYLSDSSNIPKALDITELSEDELQQIVGFFRSNSIRAGQMRGEVVECIDGNVIIRHHFNKKILWSKHDTE
jgi:bacteriocin-like protein